MSARGLDPPFGTTHALRGIDLDIAVGAALVVVTHDPRTAAYRDREVIVRDGRLSGASGTQDAPQGATAAGRLP